jgi:hypothetical protein
MLTFCGRTDRLIASLGDRIICSYCKKNMPKELFARNQLAGAAVRLENSGRMGEIKCSRCANATYSQNEEMHCETCKTWLPKAHFAKAQRKNPDNAVRS